MFRLLIKFIHKFIRTLTVGANIIDLIDFSLRKCFTDWYCVAWIKDENDRVYRTFISYSEWRNWTIDGRWYHTNFHRTNGPAIVWRTGGKEWRINGKLHRTDGPAQLKYNTEFWYLNDKLLPYHFVKQWIEDNDIDLSKKEDQLAFVLVWSN